MPKLTIPCEDCEEKKADLEMTGYRVITCEPKPGDSKMCVITFERAAAATDGAAPTAGAKNKLGKGAKAKPMGRKKAATGRKPAAKTRNKARKQRSR